MEIEEAVAAAQAGDTEAYERVGQWLITTLDQQLQNWASWHEVDDLRQQTCVAVLENLHSFEDRGRGSFARWTREIARKRAYRLWGAPAREAERLAKLANQASAWTLSLTSKLTLIELQELHGEGLATLTKMELEALIWEHEERDDHELAELQELSVKTVRTHRHRGYRKLAQFMRSARRSPLPRVVLLEQKPSPSPSPPQD